MSFWFGGYVDASRHVPTFQLHQLQVSLVAHQLPEEFPKIDLPKLTETLPTNDDI